MFGKRTRIQWTWRMFSLVPLDVLNWNSKPSISFHNSLVNSSNSVLNFMPVHCTIFDIFFCFHNVVLFFICFREGLFQFIPPVSHGDPHFKCVFWCSLSLKFSSFAKNKVGFSPGHNAIYIFLPLKLSAQLLHSQNCHILLILHSGNESSVYCAFSLQKFVVFYRVTILMK